MLNKWIHDSSPTSIDLVWQNRSSNREKSCDPKKWNIVRGFRLDESRNEWGNEIETETMGVFNEIWVKMGR